MGLPPDRGEANPGPSRPAIGPKGWPGCSASRPSSTRSAGLSRSPARPRSFFTARAASVNHIQHNTPLGMEECEGQITVNDPRHPLFGRKLKLAGLAFLPGNIRHAQVEIASGQYGYVPVTSTNLSTAPRPEPTVLTLPALQELVVSFWALPKPRRKKHAKDCQSKRVGSFTAKRAGGRGQRGSSHPHGGGGK